MPFTDFEHVPLDLSSTLDYDSGHFATQIQNESLLYSGTNSTVFTVEIKFDFLRKLAKNAVIRSDKANHNRRCEFSQTGQNVNATHVSVNFAAATQNIQRKLNTLS